MHADTVIFDMAEHFQKMTHRNRYDISGANNGIKLSIPLVNGRNQRIPMQEVRIFNEDKWQLQHWRTLVSVYKRSPYFEHYADSMQPLFETPFEDLVSYNRAALRWVKHQLRLRFEEQEAAVFVKEYAADILDLRWIPALQTDHPRYYQVFEDRIGFLPNLSILDLLFSEGPHALSILSAM